MVGDRRELPPRSSQTLAQPPGSRAGFLPLRQGQRWAEGTPRKAPPSFHQLAAIPGPRGPYRSYHPCDLKFHVLLLLVDRLELVIIASHRYLARTHVEYPAADVQEP